MAEHERFFASAGDQIKDAVTVQHGDGDWFGSVRRFSDEVCSVWRRMVERDEEGAIRLNHDSPDQFVEKISAEQIPSMALLDMLEVLRKTTEARPEIIAAFSAVRCSSFPPRPNKFAIASLG